MERKLRYLEKEIKKDGIPIMDSGEVRKIGNITEGLFNSIRVSHLKSNVMTECL